MKYQKTQMMTDRHCIQFGDTPATHLWYYQNLLISSLKSQILHTELDRFRNTTGKQQESLEEETNMLKVLLNKALSANADCTFP